MRRRVSTTIPACRVCGWRVGNYQDDGGLVCGGCAAPVQLEEETRLPLQLMTDGHYADLQAQDGTPIDSRTKHREYMRRHGVTVADDFKETWAKARKEREAYRKGEARSRESREAVARTVYRLHKS